ncbi:MAG: acyl carrier protein phosphodiesterase [Patiriisocius sp.]|jgi:acyl carrier protein phosphodiesterase
MNFLAHIYLSGDDQDITIGNFIADGIKGRKYLNYPETLQKGILLHRGIDSFTDQHPIVKQSTKRLHKNHGHYSGVIVDIFYDHFLAKNWKKYHSQPLDQYVATFYELLDKNHEILPSRIQRMIPPMVSSNWLLSYASIDGISKILEQMSVRVKHTNNMHLAHLELDQFYTQFEAEFTSFFEELRVFSKNKITSLT